MWDRKTVGPNFAKFRNMKAPQKEVSLAHFKRNFQDLWTFTGPIKVSNLMGFAQWVPKLRGFNQWFFSDFQRPGLVRFRNSSH